MTDRIASLTVVLERDMREDDVEKLAAAIRQIRGVADVANGEPVSVGNLIERARMRREMAMEVYQLIVGVPKP